MNEELLDVAGGTLWTVVYLLAGIGAAELAEWLGAVVLVQWVAAVVTVAVVVFCSQWVNDQYDQLRLDRADEWGP
jgi:membrane protein DedA with SNARE-associated domain